MMSTVFFAAGAGAQPEERLRMPDSLQKAMNAEPRNGQKMEIPGKKDLALKKYKQSIHRKLWQLNSSMLLCFR